MAGVGTLQERCPGAKKRGARAPLFDFIECRYIFFISPTWTQLAHIFPSFSDALM
jgi:hypothetical protein